jgi:hypothetical protein
MTQDEEVVVRDLVMLIRRMASRLTRRGDTGDTDLADDALEYLDRKGLTSINDILRAQKASSAK